MANLYKEPQIPLKLIDENNDIHYIYPLTTINQVIMLDGTRLESKLSVMDEDISSLSNNVSVAQGCIDTLKSGISTLSADISTLRSDIGSLNASMLEKQLKHKTATATLSASGWSNKSQTVSVSGVTASNTIIVMSAPASYIDYAECQVYCSSQSAEKLTFKCEDVPSSNLTVNIVIFD